MDWGWNWAAKGRLGKQRDQREAKRAQEHLLWWGKDGAICPGLSQELGLGLSKRKGLGLLLHEGWRWAAKYNLGLQKTSAMRGTLCW